MLPRPPANRKFIIVLNNPIIRLMSYRVRRWLPCISLFRQVIRLRENAVLKDDCSICEQRGLQKCKHALTIQKQFNQSIYTWIRIKMIIKMEFHNKHTHTRVERIIGEIKGHSGDHWSSYPFHVANFYCDHSQQLYRLKYIHTNTFMQEKIIQRLIFPKQFTCTHILVLIFSSFSISESAHLWEIIPCNCVAFLCKTSIVRVACSALFSV